MPTYTELMRGFEFGPWSVLPDRGLIRDGDTEQKLEPLVMDVFVVLASHGGEVVTKDQLIDEVWGGRPQTDDVITRCISALRRGLGDDARSPRYIETVQRRGYRVMLPVSTPGIEVEATVSQAAPAWYNYRVAGAGLIIALIMVWLLVTLDDAPDAGIATVAVFPFDCQQDPQASEAHLCFGFAEEAISSLNQIDEMQIVRKRAGYNSALFVREDGIVTGSVQIVGDRVKIAAQLEDGRRGVVLWSDTFDASKDDIFDLQRQVAVGLRAALDVDFNELTPARREPANPAAAEAYALGRYLFQKRDPQSMVDAIAQFEEAIRLDPTYGPAWLGLAYTYSIWPEHDLAIDRWATYDKGLEIIAEGIEADPSIREAAGTVYGYIYHRRYRWIEAVRATEMAVNVESAGAEDYNWHSRVLASVGRLDDALDVARKGMAIDPEYPIIVSRVAITSLWVNDLDNAKRYFDIANRMEIDVYIHSLAYSLYLFRTGQIDEAKQHARAGLEKSNVESSWLDTVIDGAVDVEARPQAVDTLDQVSSMKVVPENVEMTLWVLLGETDRAMAIARRSEQTGGLFDLEIIFSDEFKAFRRHPEFMDFVDAIGLTEYWQSAGCAWRDDKVDCRN